MSISLRKSTGPLVWCALAVLLCALAFQAGAALQVQEAEEEIPEAGKFTRLVVRSDVGRFSFMPPKGWQRSIDQGRQSIGLRSPNGIAFTITVSTNTALVGEGKIVAEVAKSALNSRFNNPVIKEQFPAFTAGASGVAFSIDHLVSGSSMSSRAAYIPMKSGALEVTLSAPFGTLGEQHSIWTGIMNSIRPEK